MIGTLLLLAAVQDPVPPLERASWIWGAPGAVALHARRTLVLPEAPKRARIAVTADNEYELLVNGTAIGRDSEGDSWRTVESYDLSGRLVRGPNVIALRLRDRGGAAGLLLAVRLEFDARPAVEVLSDASWKLSAEPDPVEFAHPEYVEGPEWVPARVIGPNGTAPWGRLGTGPAAPPAAPELPPPAGVAPGPGFSRPPPIAFVADDCSVYVPRRGDAWGVVFRVADGSRAYTEFDLPMPSKIGRKLCVLSCEGPDPAPRVLHDAGRGCLGSPSATFDGRWLLFSMAAEGDAFFHVYRMPAEGGRPERLTSGPFHDLDPVELPDGRILFSSTRIGTFEEYHAPPARALFSMKDDGTDLRAVTHTPIFDSEPKVTADGSVVFIRTDNFFDRAKVETQLHIMRPDGTGGLTAFGAESGAEYGSRLRAFGYGSPAPLPDGRIAVLSNRGNFIGDPGRPERGLVRLPGGLGDLAALPDGRLVATLVRGQGRHAVTDHLAVIDPAGGPAVLLHRSPSGSVHSPVAVAPRPRPPLLPPVTDASRASEPGSTGILVCQNVRLTTKTRADWSSIRAVRVLAGVGLTVRSSHSHIVHQGHETLDLGVVPLAPDGSFSIEVPADTPLALQAVDAEGRSELNEMSWIYVRPGERRSCVGCHAPRLASPQAAPAAPMAVASPPLRLSALEGAPRFRGNNAGVTGLMDLQFERFREIASINRFAGDPALGLRSTDPDARAAALRHMGIRRDPADAPAAVELLRDPVREVRVAAASALASLGTRASIDPLLGALADADPVTAQAAAVALEALSGSAPAGGKTADWTAHLRDPDLEGRLVRSLGSSDTAERRRACGALGALGGAAGAAALRAFVARQGGTNPYPRFEKDNRTDRFTFAADSPQNPRTLQSAVRGLGRLRDAAAVPLLAGLLDRNLDPADGNLFLAEAAFEALGRIGDDASEAAVLAAFARLREYWAYVGWYSDHPALYACHASPLHFRALEALDRLGSSAAGTLAPAIVRSLPTDPDRALLLEADDYETLAARVIRRSGRGRELVETALAILGDPAARPAGDLAEAIRGVHAAWAGNPGPENRASQVLSIVCRDRADAPRVAAAFARMLARPEEPVQRPLGNPSWTPVRHWTLFYLARTLGAIGDPAAFETLAPVLADSLHEARHGRPPADDPTVHFLHLDYTPCWRAAAADALGRVGDPRAVPVLAGAVRCLDNATDVRHSAAAALGRLARPGDLPLLRGLAAAEPEVSTRRALQAACSRGALR